MRFTVLVVTTSVVATYAATPEYHTCANTAVHLLSFFFLELTRYLHGSPNCIFPC